MVCLLFSQQQLQHLESTTGGSATKLVSKWISKKVTEYLLLLNTFTAICCIPCICVIQAAKA